MKVVFLPHFPDNPYHRLLSEGLSKVGVKASGIRGVWFISRLRALKPDVIHFHWLHPYYIGKTPLRSVAVVTLFLLQWPLLRRQGARIVWTVHNIRDHERRMAAAERLVTRLVAAAADRIIVHCGTAGDLLLRAYPRIEARKLSVVPHGSYVGVYPQGIARDEARNRLDIHRQGRVVLFLGEIRRYKGITDLVSVFSGASPPKDTTLLIAGRVHDPALHERLEKAALTHPNIRLHAGFVPDDQIQTFMAAADAVAAPFRDVLTSGSLILALSFGKAVIAPRVGCVKDMERDVLGYFYDPTERQALADALETFASDRRDSAAIGQHNRAVAETLSWARVAARTHDVYKVNETPALS
jgi:glycosyltransferase involved in cell wall biosynthesis